MPRSVVTKLIVKSRAQEARTCYVDLFGGSVTAIEKDGPGEYGGSERWAEFVIAGHRLVCIESPAKHAFRFAPSAPLLVECDDEAEFDRAFATLSDGGDVLLPPDEYVFNQRFAFLTDRFGVSWQLNLILSGVSHDRDPDRRQLAVQRQFVLPTTTIPDVP